jgi:hypothetical protein
MKKIIIFLLSLLVIGVSVGAVFYIVLNEKAEKTDLKKEIDFKNCSYNIQGKDVQLKDGYSEEEIAPGSASKLITRYFGNELRGDFDGDGLSDTAFLITQNSGGSGTFYYLTVALSSNMGCKGTNAILLGDRIAPQTTGYEDGKIVVNYADRGSGEPMTSRPSIGVSRYFEIKDGILVEIK